MSGTSQIQSKPPMHGIFQWNEWNEWNATVSMFMFQLEVNVIRFFIESVNLFKLLGIFLSSPHLFGCNWNEEEKVRINIIQSLKQFLCHRIKFSSE